jgi:hypothetical protein
MRLLSLSELLKNLTSLIYLLPVGYIHKTFSYLYKIYLYWILHVLRLSKVF